MKPKKQKPKREEEEEEEDDDDREGEEKRRRRRKKKAGGPIYIYELAVTVISDGSSLIVTVSSKWTPHSKCISAGRTARRCLNRGQNRPG